MRLFGISFKKVVTEDNPVPVSYQGDNMPYDYRKAVTPDNPVPVSGTGGGGGGGKTQKYSVTADGQVNSVNRVFVLPTAATADSVRPYINGVRQNPFDYSVDGDGVTVTFVMASTPQTDDALYFDYEEA